jgi:sugar phosphate isomerase/epimerase
LCAELGGSVLVLGSPKQRSFIAPQTREQAFENAVRGLREVCECALPLAVNLAVEPLAPKLTNFLNTAAEAIELIERIQRPNARLHLDVAAMSNESLPIPEIVRRSARHLAHFHANDPNQRGPGFGEVDFRPILAALRSIDYAGYVSVEVFDFNPDPETIAERSLRYLESCVQ